MILKYCELNGVDNNYKSFKNIVFIVIIYCMIYTLQLLKIFDIGLNRNIAEMSG